MAYKVQIDIPWIMLSQKAIWKSRMRTFQEKVFDWVNSRTPENEWVLLENNEKSEILDIGNKIVCSVFNTLYYAWFVEDWVMWQERNYHKPAWQVMVTDIWAWMYKRTWFAERDNF